MGIQILPAECREFHSNKVAITIRPKVIGLQAVPDDRPDHAPYVEPAHRTRRFRDAWKAPDSGTVEAIRLAGFDLPGDVISLTRWDAGWLPEPPETSDDGLTSPTDSVLWTGVPLLVGIDQLPPLPHGA